MDSGDLRDVQPQLASIMLLRIGRSIRYEDIWERLCDAVIDIPVTLRHPPPSPRPPPPPVDQVSLAEGEVGVKQRVLHLFFSLDICDSRSDL